MGTTAAGARAAAAGRQRRRLDPALLAHAATVTAMAVFMLWVFMNYRLVPYSQSHQPGQLQETACSRGTDHPHTAGPHAGSLQPSSSSSSRSRRQSADHTHTNRGRVAGRHTHASKHGFSYAADSLPSRHTGTWTDHLLARLAAEKKQAQDPEYQAKLRAAVSTPIHVVLMAGTFWSVTEASTRGCQVNGLPLDCRISNDTQSPLVQTADALHYHVPHWLGKPRRKAFANQLRLAMSLESSAYYEELDDPSYMCHFDAEMTYRHCAQVTNWYSLEALDQLFDDPTIPQVPFEDKLHAIAYINSNCEAESGRSDLLRALMKLGDNAKVPVHSFGNCDRNMDWPDDNPTKFQVFSEYKFCVTMENSLRQDYISEKIWDGLRSGCIPVYLGSNSVRDVVPDPGSFVMFDPSGGGDASTAEELDALLHQIGSDRQRYESMTAWRYRKPEEQPNPLFRHLWEIRGTTGECQMCQFLARHRADPKPSYTTCLFDRDWMSTADQEFIPREQACPAGNSYQRRRRGYGFGGN